MTNHTDYKNFVIDQLSEIGEFDTKNMFGGTVLLRDGTAFAKIKHGSVWMKAGKNNLEDYLRRGLEQYTYGKEGTRKLNFYAVPDEIVEDRSELQKWAKEAIIAASASE